MFLVRTPDGEGYIDSNYCMINLPDYLGELCAYDITNSYASLYMVHGYEIPDVTGTVILGYEDVELAEGEYLVPLLYPSAQKLAAAAQAALADGYRLKIYDAYRPREASLSIYGLTGQHLNDPIPDATYSGEPVDDLPADIPLLSELLARQAAENAASGAPADQPEGTAAAPTGLDGENGWLFDLGREEEAASSQAADSAPPTSSAAAPSASSAADSGAAASAPPAGSTLPSEAPADQPADEEESQPQEPEQYLTYYLLMTNGIYRLGSFLAQHGSTHNLGIAMDLTLEKYDTGEELVMQTAIHDLSHYSVLEHNNENADLLAGYMLDAGFAPLATEWWHFQDDDTRAALALDTYQEQGVSPEGWHRDIDGSWYYCLADGTRTERE